MMLFCGLLVCLSFLASVQAGSYEVIIQKYQALEYQEVVGIEKSKYVFSFCMCSHESRRPQNDPLCDCSLGVPGKTAQASCPQALYSSSCLHSPNPKKCLYAKLSSNTRLRYLYVKVEIKGRLLTNPEWQSLQYTKHKTNAQLAANINNKRIKLSYIVSESDGGSFEADHVITPKVHEPETKTTRSFKPHPSSSPLSQKTHVHHVVAGPATPKKLSTEVTTYAPPKPSPIISNYHGDLEAIKSIIDAEMLLLHASRAQRVSPLAFDLAGFRKAMVAAHNRFRYQHGAELLSYDTGLEAAATSWANKLAAKGNCLNHENRKGMGENLFFFAAEFFTDPVTMAEAVVRTFYAEGRGYDYKRYKRNYFQTGHFTQLIWKSTTKMGVGISIKKFNGRRTGPCQPFRPSHMLYIVVKYSPQGNVQSPSVYLDNVRPVMRRL